MKRSVLNNLSSKIGIALLLTFMSIGPLAKAQTEEVRESQSVSISTNQDGKVTLKVVQKKGFDETSFEKTYDSYEEMQNDPDLEKYGIDTKSFRFGSNSTKPQLFLHNGPARGFWDDDFDMSGFKDMQERMESMMREFSNGSFGFSFGDQNMMDIDSLMQRFSFQNKNGSFLFNGKSIENLDSLSDALQNQFGNFTFGFGDSEEGKSSFGAWGLMDDEDEVRVVTRAKVVVKSASEEDKKLVGTDTMDGIELQDISFYPNPSDGRFDVDIASGSNAPIQVIIVDEGANEVYNSVATPLNGQHSFHVDLTNEGKGIYIMKLVQKGKALTKRVVIE